MTDTKAAIKSALEHAIEDRLSFLDSIKKVTDMDDVKESTREKIRAWRKILKRRYGSSDLPHDEALKGAKLVPAIEP